MHFSKQGKCGWINALPLAAEAYDGSVHAGLLQNGTSFSLAELWLGRKLRFNSDVRPAIHLRPYEAQQYGEWVRHHTQAVKDWVANADSERRTSMKHAGPQIKLRTLNVGDTISLLVPDLDRRAKNSGAERRDGPREI